jgi:hypothetical protein
MKKYIALTTAGGIHAAKRIVSDSLHLGKNL